MTRTGRKCRHLHGSCDTEGTGSAAILRKLGHGWDRKRRRLHGS